MCIILINPFKVPVVYTGVFTSNNEPKNIRTQSNKHISQTTRYQLIFLFFNESKTVFIKTISSCRYVTTIKPKMHLCLNKNNLKKNNVNFMSNLKKLKPTMF
jgi:hypothetical protein